MKQDRIWLISALVWRQWLLGYMTKYITHSVPWGLFVEALLNHIKGQDALFSNNSNYEAFKMGHKSAVCHLSSAVFIQTQRCSASLCSQMLAMRITPADNRRLRTGWLLSESVAERLGYVVLFSKQPHNLTNLHTAPYGCCRHLKMAVAKPITAIEPITVSLMLLHTIVISHRCAPYKRWTLGQWALVCGQTRWIICTLFFSSHYIYTYFKVL